MPPKRTKYSEAVCVATPILAAEVPLVSPRRGHFARITHLLLTGPNIRAACVRLRAYLSDQRRRQTPSADGWRARECRRLGARQDQLIRWPKPRSRRCPARCPNLLAARLRSRSSSELRPDRRRTRRSMDRTKRKRTKGARSRDCPAGSPTCLHRHDPRTVQPGQVGRRLLVGWDAMPSRRVEK